MTEVEAIGTLERQHFTVTRVIRGSPCTRVQLHIACNQCLNRWSLNQRDGSSVTAPEFNEANILKLLDHAAGCERKPATTGD